MIDYQNLLERTSRDCTKCASLLDVMGVISYGSIRNLVLGNFVRHIQAQH